MMAALLNFCRYSKLFLTTCSLVLLNYKHLEAECIYSYAWLRWSIYNTYNYGRTHTRLIGVPTTSVVSVTPLRVNSIIFSFAVISAPNTPPLITTLTIDEVTPYLNTSRISCVEVHSGNSESVSIHVLEPTTLKSMYVDYHLMDPYFSISNVTVMLLLNETNQEYESGSLVAYNVTAPAQVDVQIYESTQFQLVIPYNTQVNVSIIASLCGQHSIPTIIQLLYTNCRHPLEQQLKYCEEINGSPLMVIGDIQDMMPVMEGFNISFSCHFEFKLSGPTSSTCMRNGEWEPDPREVECRHKVNCGPPSTPQYSHVHPFTSTLEGEEVVFSCSNSDQESRLLNETNLTATVCSSSGTWIPNPQEICTKDLNLGMVKSTRIDAVLVGIIASSVTFALTTVMCFIIGSISGRLSTNFTKCAKLSRRDSVNSNITSYNMPTNPVYEDILPQETRPREKDLELKENVAYVL